MTITKINFFDHYRKLEEQLKTMQLEDQLSVEKSRSERQRLANEQNHIYRMHLLSKLENDHQLYNPYDERKAHSENGKDKLAKAAAAIELSNGNNVTTEKPYKYFSNSARYPERDALRGRYTDAAVDALMQIDDNETSTDSYCKRCHPRNTRSICDRCDRKRRYEHCLRCNQHLRTLTEQRLGICEKCQHAETDCAFCRRNDDVCTNCKQTFCVRCRRLQQQEQQKDAPTMIAQPSHRSHNHFHSTRLQQPSHLGYEIVHESSGGESDHELDGIDPIVVRNDDNDVPFSVNVPRYSMFHPSNQLIPNSVDEIRRKTDERIAKYVKNYSDLKRQPKRIPMIIARSNVDDSFPLPLLRENSNNNNNWRTPNQFIEHERMKSDQSPAVKMLDTKWSIPAVQKNTITSNGDGNNKKPIRVLTQLGAVRRQLQMEKLNLN